MKEASLGIVMGTVCSCEKVASAKRLYHLVIDVGDKQVEVASALPHFLPEGKMIGVQLPVKIDVEPAVMHGITSTARLIAIKTKDGQPILLLPEKLAANGDEVV